MAMLFNIDGKLQYLLQLLHTYPQWWRVLHSRFTHQPLERITLRNGLTVVGGPKSLITDLIHEIFIAETYTPAFLKIKPGDTVIDIGANVGVFSLYAAHAGATTIYAVEPTAENVSYIKQNFQLNQLPAPIIIEKAMSDHDGTAKLYFGPLDSHNLLFDHAYNQRFEKFRTVATTSLESLFAHYTIGTVDFLKMDCEGSEGAIFSTTPPHIWKKVQKLAIEYHNPVSLLSHTQLVMKLRKLGFKTRLMPSDQLYGYIYAWR